MSGSDEQAFLLAMYKEQCDQARQHENLRQQSTNLIFALAASMVTFFAAVATLSVNWIVNNNSNKSLTWMIGLYSVIGIIVVVLGVFGKRLSLKHYERNRLHTERARSYRKELEKRYDAPHYKELRDSDLKNHFNHWITIRPKLEDNQAAPSVRVARKPNEQGLLVAETGGEIRQVRLYNRSAYSYWARMYLFLIVLGIVMIIIPICFALYPWWQYLLG